MEFGRHFEDFLQRRGVDHVHFVKLHTLGTAAGQLHHSFQSDRRGIDKVVDDSDVVARLNQSHDGVHTDVTGATCYQNIFRFYPSTSHNEGLDVQWKESTNW